MLRTNVGSTDIAQVWHEYLGWAEKMQPQDAGCLLRRACYEMGELPGCRDSLIHLRMWVKLAEVSRNPLEIFAYLDGKEIGRRHALLYEAWALAAEQRRLYKTARDLYAQGIRLGARPVDRLQARQLAFEGRMRKRQAQARVQERTAARALHNSRQGSPTTCSPPPTWGSQQDLGSLSSPPPPLFSPESAQGPPKKARLGAPSPPDASAVPSFGRTVAAERLAAAAARLPQKQEESPGSDSHRQVARPAFAPSDRQRLPPPAQVGKFARSAAASRLQDGGLVRVKAEPAEDDDCGRSPVSDVGRVRDQARLLPVKAEPAEDEWRQVASPPPSWTAPACEPHTAAKEEPSAEQEPEEEAQPEAAADHLAPAPPPPQGSFFQLQDSAALAAARAAASRPLTEALRLKRGRLSELARRAQHSSEGVTQLARRGSAEVSQLARRSSEGVSELARRGSQEVSQLARIGSKEVSQLARIGGAEVSKLARCSSTEVSKLARRSSVSVSKFARSSSAEVSNLARSSSAKMSKLARRSSVGVSKFARCSKAGVSKLARHSGVGMSKLARRSSVGLSKFARRRSMPGLNADGSDAQPKRRRFGGVAALLSKFRLVPRRPRAASVPSSRVTPGAEARTSLVGQDIAHFMTPRKQYLSSGLEAMGELLLERRQVVTPRPSSHPPAGPACASDDAGAEGSSTLRSLTSWLPFGRGGA